MRHIYNYLSFTESNSFSNIKMTKDDNYHVDYTFEDHSGNRFLVQFKNITIGKNTLSKEYTMSYFTWDSETNTGSVSKLLESIK